MEQTATIGAVLAIVFAVPCGVLLLAVILGGIEAWGRDRG